MMVLSRFIPRSRRPTFNLPPRKLTRRDIERYLQLPQDDDTRELIAAAVAEGENYERIPEGLQTAAGWAWRLIVIAIALWGVGYAITYLSIVTVPLAIAILITAMLYPMAARLKKWGWRPVFASLGSLLMLVLVISGILTGVSATIVVEAPELVNKLRDSVNQLTAWLAEGPLQIRTEQFNQVTEAFFDWVNTSRIQIAATVAKAGGYVGNLVAGLVIAVISTYFFLSDGRNMWLAPNSLLPRHYRDSVDVAARAGWKSLVGYMRATVTVAFVDALGVFVVALLLRVPMPWALFGLTFILSFIPVVGAFTAGLIAVLLAFLSPSSLGGPLAALLMLAGTILVMNVESQFLQPILLGRAAKLHPLAVILGITVGGSVAGIAGAFLVIPVMAFGVAFTRTLLRPSEIPVADGG